MNVRVLYFGSLAHDVGVAEQDLSLSDNAHVADALSSLSSQHPVIQRFGDRLATAVNLEYVGAQHTLKDGDELALIPPVSGG